MSNNKIKQLTQEEIKTHFSSGNTAQAVICNFTVMKCLKEQIKQLEKVILTQVRLEADFQELISINGIGNILALTIMLETGNIDRFSKVGNYASYCRCISGARYSNGKKKDKTNSKNSNKYLA